MSLLHLVPAEIFTHIAVFLACDDPYSPPTDLLALQATHPDFHLSLNCHINPAVWAAAFRFRFDHLAVLRRNFRPNGRDYYDQLRQYTETLAAVRRLDADLDEEAIRTIYVMLLDNNGKNRSQLERAGVDAFLHHYLRTRLWLGAENHDGWPIESAENAYILWALWLVTTPEKLALEPTAERERIVALLLPYVLNPYRYCQAEAPPCHFVCPLPASPRQISPISMPSAHGPYPVYADPGRLVALPYFGSMPAFAPPPITPAAKLLYFARREIIPFNIPPHLPRTRAEAPASTEPHPVQETLLRLMRTVEPHPRRPSRGTGSRAASASTAFATTPSQTIVSFGIPTTGDVDCVAMHGCRTPSGDQVVCTSLAAWTAYGRVDLPYVRFLVDCYACSFV